ncbi:MAG: hypothetical protein IJV37_05560 [Bacteroidales bacterium]|nr:hypothetical protein [Bacteroidales bacterium]
MKHIITKILYRSVFSDGSFYNLGMIPASGTLRIRTEDSDNGRLITYELEATAVRTIRRVGDAALEGDLFLIVTYDNGLQARIGTAERPARLKLDVQDTLKVSCTWQTVL